MTKSLLVFTLLVTVMTCQLAKSQELATTPMMLIDTRMGLEENKVRDVWPMSSGKVVVFTSASLQLFDGARFTDIPVREVAAYELSIANNYRFQQTDAEGIHWCKYKRRLTAVDLLKREAVADVGSLFRRWGVRDSIADFFIDNAGMAWLLDRRGMLYCHYGKGRAAAVPVESGDDILAIASVNRRSYVCHHSGLVEELDMSASHRVGRQLSLPPALADSLKGYAKAGVADGMLWIVRQYAHRDKSLLLSMDIATHRWRQPLVLAGQLYDLDFTADGQTLVAGKSHLYAYCAATGVIADLLPACVNDGSRQELTDEVCCLTVDGDGGWWIGLRSKGMLYRHPVRTRLFTRSGQYFPRRERMDVFYDDEARGLAQQLAPDITNCTLRDTRGHILIGTRDGLFITCPGNKPVLHLTEDDGLASRNIAGLIETADGNLWVAATQGISCLRPTAEGRWQLRTFGPTEGLLLAGAEIQNRAIKRLGDSILVGIADGSLRFSPVAAARSRGYWHDINAPTSPPVSGLTRHLPWTTVAMLLAAVLCGILALMTFRRRSQQRHPSDTDDARKRNLDSIMAAQPAVPLTDANEQFLDKLRRTVTEHVSDENLNVQTLSGLMAMDRSVLYRRMLALTGTSPSAYILNLRMQTAMRQLQNGSLPVKEVAASVGFSNAKYFSTVFKKTFGISPQQVRQTATVLRK